MTTAPAAPAHVFEVTHEEQQKIDEWLALTDAKLKANGASTYTGAIGGRLTFSFTNTTLGQVLKVTDSLSSEELDLTDYDQW